MIGVKCLWSTIIFWISVWTLLASGIVLFLGHVRSRRKTRHNLRTRILSTETSDATFLNCQGLLLERLLCVVAHYTPAIGSCKHVFKGYDVVKLHAYDHCFVCTSFNQETHLTLLHSLHEVINRKSSWSALTVMFPIVIVEKLNSVSKQNTTRT